MDCNIIFRVGRPSFLLIKWFFFTFLFISGVLLLAANTCALFDSNSEVVDLTETNFDRLVTQSDHVWIVEFFAPWCGHCQQFVGEYSKAAKALKVSNKKEYWKCNSFSYTNYNFTHQKIIIPVQAISIILWLMFGCYSSPKCQWSQQGLWGGHWNQPKSINKTKFR